MMTGVTGHMVLIPPLPLLVLFRMFTLEVC